MLRVTNIFFNFAFHPFYIENLFHLVKNISSMNIHSVVRNYDRSSFWKSEEGGIEWKQERERERRKVIARSGNVLNFSKRWRVLGSAARDSNPSRVSRHFRLFIDGRSI